MRQVIAHSQVAGVIGTPCSGSSVAVWPLFNAIRAIAVADEVKLYIYGDKLAPGTQGGDRLSVNYGQTLPRPIRRLWK